MKISQHLKEGLSILAIALFLSILIRVFIGEVYIVEGLSMLPTLEDNERIIVNKLPNQISDYHQGDIVVIEFDGEIEKDIVKRIIAKAGDTIEIDNGKVLVNDVILQEEYLDTITQGCYQKTKVPQNKVFVMGDNRNHSLDSRFEQVGFIDISKLKGRAIVVIWPLQELRILSREGR